MERKAPTTTNLPEARNQRSSPSLVGALSTALKNIAIYPAAHPRVTSAATDFLAHIAAKRGPLHSCVLLVRGDEITIGDERLEADAAVMEWLSLRFREAGLCGIEFTSACKMEDMLGFATALNQTRARSGTNFFAHWAQPNSRLIPLPLVFQGQHVQGAPGASPPTDAERAATRPGIQLPPQIAADARIRAVIQRMATTSEVQDRLQAIARCTRASGKEDTRELDLFEIISDLLPADVASDPTAIEEVVARILTRVEESLGELVRRKAKVKGADLLRKALGVARKYFHSDAPRETIKAGLPSGRPEDEKIQADLGLLQKEIAELPAADDLHLPSAAELGANSPVVARELVGVCLHAMAATDKTTVQEKLKERLRRVRPGIVADLSDVFSAYVSPAADTSAAGAATRLRILTALVDIGHAQLVRTRQFLDAAFVVRGFPEALPLAARVLGGDEAGRAILRNAFNTMAPMLQAGGLAATVNSGILADPVVVRTLALTGGEVALQLLVQAAARTSPAGRQVLHEHLRTLELPAAEHAVVHSYETGEGLPRDYVQSLLVASGRERFDGSLTAASAGLLRRRVLQASGTMSLEAMLTAIDNLVLAEGPETVALLQRLAREGRFTQFRRRARAVRRCAAETLDRLQQEQRP